MKPKSYSSFIVILGAATGLVACQTNNNVGGIPANGSNGAQSAVKFYPVQVKAADNSSESIAFIRLMPLTQEHIQKANQMALQSASLQSASVPETSYSLGNGINGFPNNFYSSSPNLTPLNQQSFGTCVTFSTSAALSYLYSNYSSTVNVSPLDILDAGYELNTTNISLTGWDGLQDAATLLTRLQTVGYYNNYNNTATTYNNLSNAYLNTQTGNQGSETGLTIAQLQNIPGFSSQLSAFDNLGGINSYTNTFTNLSSKWSNLFTDYSSNNATLVKNALDNGDVVLLAFDIYYASVAANSTNCTNGVGVHTVGTMQYKYNPSTGTINQTTASSATANNTWASPTGCLLGGHEVWVVGYATASDGSLVFIIRNSWGNSGDSGQYYMTDTYLNTAASSASIVHL